MQTNLNLIFSMHINLNSPPLANSLGKVFYFLTLLKKIAVP